MNMMYPRLFLAKNLLNEEGIIFLNIGEGELTNLEKVCNEIFGEENKISIITRVAKTASNLGTHFASSTDFILCYSKNLSVTPSFKANVDESLYTKIEKDGLRKGERYRDDVAFYQSSQKDIRPNQKYFVECPDGSRVLPPCSIQDEIMREGDGRWRWSKETYLTKKNFVVFKKTNRSPLVDENGERAKWNLYTKSYLSDREEEGTLPRNILTDFINRKGADLLKKYNISFDFSKPVELLEYLMSIVSMKKDDVVLDFFAGSGSTAHALINFTTNSLLKLKFILVQLPEQIADQEFNNVADIGKERIRRVIKKIEEEQKQNADMFTDDKPQLDLGFKVFKLAPSNVST